MTTDYARRLRIAVEGNPTQQLFTASGALFSCGYERVEIGGRGPYVEFRREQIECPLRRADVEHYYYVEHRSVPDRIKVYDQLHRVDYADYRIGLLYVSPFDLFLHNRERAIEVPAEKQGRLFL